ncbi:MAG TPA: hypothetical protein VES20_18875 [Bryobacteraceae bacterium]|nr:hypothetical protein [Bryobacteraceae bacterium]
MADQLYLSYFLQAPSAQKAVRSFEKLLGKFPWSRLSNSATTLRIHAVAPQEPPLFERSLDDPPDLEAILGMVREFACGDCGLYLDTSWDLWQYETEWKLSPARVTLAAFAPEFESGSEDHVRIEFGIDEMFLPQPDLPNSMFMARSNVRSLLHLVHELDTLFGASERRLWTESGENFAERLQAALEGSGSAGE